MRIVELPKYRSTHRQAVVFAALAGLLATLLLVFLPNPAVRARPSNGAVGGQVMTTRETANFRSSVGVADAGSVDVNPMIRDELPTVTIEAMMDSVNEGAGPVGFRFNADPAPGSDLYVTVESEQPEIAAWLPSDYWDPFSVKIPAGSSTSEFDLPIRNLYNLDGEGSITLSIVADEDQYLLGESISAAVAVIDDDETITVAYAQDQDIRVSEGVGQVEVELKITVDRIAPPGTYEIDDEISEGVPFLIETFPGTAIPPGDFGHSFHIVRLPVGSFVETSSGEYGASISVTWEIEDDVLDEGGDEDFYVVTPMPAVPALTQPSEPKRIVIEDNDDAMVRLVSDRIEIVEGESTSVWAVLDGGIVFDQPEALGLHIRSISGSQDDYSVDSARLNFASGSEISSNQIAFSALHDDLVEPAETFRVSAIRGGGDVGTGIEISIIDPTPPKLDSAVVDRSTLTLDFDEDLNEGSEPQPDAFIVQVGEDDLIVTGVSIDVSEVNLTVASAVEAGQAVTVSYSVPAAMGLQGADRVPVAAIENYEANNVTLNNAPTFEISEMATSVAEDTAVGSTISESRATDDDASQSLTFTLGGDEIGNFQLAAEDRVATITLARQLDRESAPVHNLILRVDDGNGGTATSEIKVAVMGDDVPGEVMIVPDHPFQSLPVAAYVTDEDGIVGEVDWEWSLSDAANGPFTSAQVAGSNIYVPTADDVGKYLKATARYDDGHGTGTVAEMVSPETVGADIPDDTTTDGRVTVGGGPVSGYIDPGYATFSMNGAGVCSGVDRVFDHDLWGVEVVEGRNYLIEMLGADTGDGTLLETRLWGMANKNGEDKTAELYGDVYDAYGDIGSGQGRNSRMVFTAVETGLVYIDVSSNNSMNVDLAACPITWWYPERQTGSYELEVASVHGVLEGQSGAASIAVGSMFDGILDEFAREWFVVSLVAGREYEIVLEGGSNPPSKLQFPVIYGVYDPNGSTLPGSSDGRNGYGNAIVTISPDVSGGYYIQIGDGTQLGVWVNGGPRGAFRFSINQTGD